MGDALGILADIVPDVRVINLETSITASGEFAPGKAVHYRMSPGNVGCVAAARPDARALANNHVLDFGRRGLPTPCGRWPAPGSRDRGSRARQPDSRAPGGRPGARRPAHGHRVLRHRLGGIPPGWAAGPGRPGVNRLPDLSPATADDLIGQVQAARRPGDIALVSIHWGSNWGYGLGADQVRFARRLIDGGVDLVHGHSSHHPRPIEASTASSSCTAAATASMTARASPATAPTGRTCACSTSPPSTPAPASSPRCGWPRCRPATCGCTTPAADRAWLMAVLERISHGYGSRIDLRPDGILALRQAPSPAAPRAPAR